MSQPFNPAEVPINYTLNFQQVNLLLEGLGKLPYERVEQLYTALRSVGLNTLQDAEQTYNKNAGEQGALVPADGINDQLTNERKD